MKGIPLSYVVRANEDPDHETDFEGDFVARSIACAPLNNATFRANAWKVHQLLMNFLVAEWAEQWIKNLAPRVNGRLEMEALRNHYGGEGDASQPIATAKKLRETLHYKVKDPCHSVPSLIVCRRCLTCFRRKVRNLPKMQSS